MTWKFPLNGVSLKHITQKTHPLLNCCIFSFLATCPSASLPPIKCQVIESTEKPPYVRAVICDYHFQSLSFSDSHSVSQLVSQVIRSSICWLVAWLSEWLTDWMGGRRLIAWFCSHTTYFSSVRECPHNYCRCGMTCVKQGWANENDSCDWKLLIKKWREIILKISLFFK